MKQIVLLAGVAIMLAATGCDDKNKGNGRLDPSAMVSLRYAKTAPQTSATTQESRADGHLTAREIVDQANDICFTNKRLYPDLDQTSRGFSDAQKDYVNERLLMWGSDIINPETGALTSVFIGGEDMVLRRAVDIDKDIVDTIAYLSNATLRTAEAAILEAYAREDYTAVYKLFDEAFTFTPITGAEWRELKRQGIN